MGTASLRLGARQEVVSLTAATLQLFFLGLYRFGAPRLGKICDTWQLTSGRQELGARACTDFSASGIQSACIASCRGLGLVFALRRRRADVFSRSGTSCTAYTRRHVML